MPDGEFPESDETVPDAPSILDLLLDLWAQSRAQLGGEWALAKAEFSQKLKQALTGAAMLVVAVVLGFLGLTTLASTCIAGLVSLGLAPPFAGLIVTIIIFAIATVLILIGLRAVNPARLKMSRTVRSVRRDVEIVTKGQTDVSGHDDRSTRVEGSSRGRQSAHTGTP